MRTYVFHAAAAATLCLSQVQGATLSSFPVYDETIDFAQQSDSIWSIDELSQYAPATIGTGYSGYTDMEETNYAEIDLSSDSYTFLHTYAQGSLDALAALETCTDCQWLLLDKIGGWAKKSLDFIEEKLKGTGKQLINIGMAVLSTASSIIGGVPGTLINMIKHSYDIIQIMKKPMGEITTKDVAVLCATIPILGKLIKAYSTTKTLKDRMKHGDKDACYRKNWHWSPISSCTEGQKKWAGMICMDDCSMKAGMEICPTFSLMCATAKYCNYFKETLVADLISTALTLMVVIGTSGGLGILTLFTKVLTLTEKFAHPKCGEDSAAFIAEHKKAQKALKKAKKAEKKKLKSKGGNKKHHFWEFWK